MSILGILRDFFGSSDDQEEASKLPEEEGPGHVVQPGDEEFDLMMEDAEEYTRTHSDTLRRLAE